MLIIRVGIEETESQSLGVGVLEVSGICVFIYVVLGMQVVYKVGYILRHNAHVVGSPSSHPYTETSCKRESPLSM